jgi:hypothetical protein
MWKVICHVGEVLIRKGKFMTRGGEVQTCRHQGFEIMGDSWDLLQRKKQTTIGEGLWNGWFLGSWIRNGSFYCVEFDLKNGIF